MHRRSVLLDGSAFTVLALRPSASCRFSTNFFHDTWHVLSDASGARLLGRVFWSMAYQRHPNTVVVIDQRHLVPNPFDADPASPIVIANSDLGGISRTALSQLKRQLPFATPSAGTVRLATAGLDSVGADRDHLDAHQKRTGDRYNPDRQRGWITRVNGMVVLAGKPATLQWWAMWCRGLGDPFYKGTDYAELSTTEHGTGEVQIFERFHAMVSEAADVRSRLFPGAHHRELLDDERAMVWAALRADRVIGRAGTSS
jgi:hypothetical protein